MKTNPAIAGMLGLVLVVGCARTSVPSGQPPRDAVPNPQCVRRAQVTVHIENRSSHTIAVFFGSNQARAGARPFSTIQYEVARSYLQSPIQVVAQGGLTGPPASIRTEPVVCNDATLIIGSQPSESIFIGDVWRRASGDSGR